MMETLAPKSTITAPSPPRIRLEYLDGLRGLAALFVVLMHTYYSFCMEFTLTHRIAQATYFLYLGRSAVDIFIVLSGYCLMLPVVRGPEKRLPGGLRVFFLRRARRILPPYYGALVASYVLIAICPWLRHSSISSWNDVFPISGAGVVLSHILLLHNLSPEWAHKIDYPLWSVATEWQIYFVFALLLLPVWRRFGAWATGLVAFAVGFALLLAFPQALSQASPHFLGLFALGMIAADINFSPEKSWQERLDWGKIAVAAFLVLCIPPSLYHRFFSIPVIGKDLLVGLGTACLLVYCTRCLQGIPSPRRPWILGLLQSRALVMLGAFSYSLYLIHAPVIASVQPLLASFHLPATLSLAVMFLMTIPAALGFSYLFYLVFERPFVARRSITPS